MRILDHFHAAGINIGIDDFRMWNYHNYNLQDWPTISHTCLEAMTAFLDGRGSDTDSGVEFPGKSLE